MAELTLMDKAISFDNVAKLCLKYRHDDEGFLSLCCFHLQQAHELLLKHLLELHNISYKRSHDIYYLVDTLETKLPIYCEELKEIADELTEWEANSRYASDFLGTVKSAERAQQTFDLMLNEVEFNFQCINSEDFKFCYLFIKEQGCRFEPEIIKCMEDIVRKKIQRPFSKNVYTTMKSKLEDYFKGDL